MCSGPHRFTKTKSYNVKLFFWAYASYVSHQCWRGKIKSVMSSCRLPLVGVLSCYVAQLEKHGVGNTAVMGLIAWYMHAKNYLKSL